jgi:V8-like Glu-specific endopeptidase
VPEFREEKKNVFVSGYGEDYQIIHSNPLIFRDDGGRYDIDTEAGQSGSPVCFLEDVEGQELCHLVGIHKGYEKKGNLNICTMITEEVIAKLEKWMIEMRVGSEAKGTEEKLKILKSYSSSQKRGP